jgi:hypothetical protein
MLIASFSFDMREDRFSASTSLNGMLILTRVLPLLGVAVVCLLTVPPSRIVAYLRELTRPPFIVWGWYAGVAIVSGAINADTPTAWSTWKCIEILMVIFWGAAVSLRARDDRDIGLVKDCFVAIAMVGYLVCVWSLTEVFQGGTTLRDYILRGERLDTTFPHINSITLSVISAFVMAAGLLLTGRVRFTTRLLLLIPVLLVFGLSRSRTGLLAFLVLCGYAILTSTMNRGRKAAIVLVSLGMLGALALSSDLREWMRVDSVKELAKGSGRILTEDEDRSGWGDTLRVIQKSPEIGIGFVILRRFVDERYRAVDNFVLQSLVVAGFVGATPMILYVVYVMFSWLQGLALAEAGQRQLAELGMTATCVATIKSLTTNAVATFSFSLIIFILGAISLNIVRQSARERRFE